ncbi:hypothetical protein CJD38_15295 [Stenotrophobium rhamnosiphilum]|uniref:DNA-binding protein n=1 Tax=Stenotrophobium rhamnosiphilum TaxID=2029166 RepID=A0A2T5MCJ6_9GAMM|nr:hypothetical protein CJD38_15295 [Stenotrophobium rhamnosiphilum]
MSSQPLEATLLGKYGALMDVGDLAELLGSTPTRVTNGFAIDLPWCRPLRRARIKLGRQVRFNTHTVAEVLIEMQQTETAAELTSIRR